MLDIEYDSGSLSARLQFILPLLQFSPAIIGQYDGSYGVMLISLAQLFPDLNKATHM
jgi:hypothetical protein